MLHSQKKVCSDFHILLVEPDEFLADIYEKNLLMEDFKVTKVSSGEQALKTLEKKEVDLVLLSLTLPKTNGFEVLEIIRGEKKLKNLPVIMLSKMGLKEDIIKAQTLGANHFLIKVHFRPSEIVDKVKKVLLHF